MHRYCLPPHQTAEPDRACRMVPPRLPEAMICVTTLGSGCPPPPGPSPFGGGARGDVDALGTRGH